MWRQSSSVKAVNLVKKSFTVSEIVNFFPKGLFFIGAPCRYYETLSNGRSPVLQSRGPEFIVVGLGWEGLLPQNGT